MKRGLKIVAVIILIGLITSFVRIGGNEKPVPAVKAEFLSWVKKDTSYYLSAIVNLVNNSTDTIYYMTWSCSWQDLFETNTDKLHLNLAICDKNVKRKVTILPHDTVANVILLNEGFVLFPNISEKEKDALIGLKFNIGFHFIRVSKISTLYYDDMNRKDTILWSNQIEITKDLPINLDK